MRIVINGKINSNEIEDAIYNAFNMAIDIIEKENKDLYRDITGCHDVVATSVVADIGFIPNEGDEPQILATDAGEVLTFRFSADEDATVKLEGNNIEEPIFSDTDRAFVDLAEGLKEVPQTIDTSGIKILYTGHVSGLDLKVFEDGTVVYYKNGVLVQEATVPLDKLDAFIEEVQGIIGRQDD